MSAQDVIKLKRKRAHMLLSNAHLLEAKDDILAGFGASRLRDLSEQLLDELIIRVEELIEEKHSDASQLVRSWRHKCLRMVQECGVDTSDWNRVNAFLMDKRIAGKHLYELNVSELVTLFNKLHNVAPLMAEQREKEAAFVKQN